MDQRSVIEAALSALSVRWDELYKVLAVPDEEERVLPAVDLLVEGGGGRLLVIEHTIVESFADRIRDDVRVSDFATQVESELAGTLPKPGYFRVVLNPASLPGRGGLGDLVTAVCGWVESRAPSLEVGSPHSAPRHITEDRGWRAHCASGRESRQARIAPIRPRGTEAHVKREQSERVSSYYAEWREFQAAALRRLDEP